MPRSRRFRIIAVCIAIGVMTLIGPTLIHAAYRMATPASAKQARTERYHFLANAEVADPSLSAEQRSRMRQERMKLFYWFHSRGWPIDEGDDEESLLLPWRELIRHWTGRVLNS